VEGTVDDPVVPIKRLRVPAVQGLGSDLSPKRALLDLGNSPDQGFPPRARAHLFRFPNKADEPAPRLLARLQPHRGAFPLEDLVPYAFVDGVVDRDDNVHVLGARVPVLALEGGVERGRGRVDPVGFGGNGRCLFGRVGAGVDAGFVHRTSCGRSVWSGGGGGGGRRRGRRCGCGQPPRDARDFAFCRQAARERVLVGYIVRHRVGRVLRPGRSRLVVDGAGGSGRRCLFGRRRSTAAREGPHVRVRVQYEEAPGCGSRSENTKSAALKQWH
jgi:hypothetical protein